MAGVRFVVAVAALARLSHGLSAATGTKELYTSKPASARIPMELDEAKLLAESTFAIPPEELVALAKDVLVKGIGLFDDGECLAEDFEFCAAVVGPIDKSEYLNAVRTFDLTAAFDTDARYYGFRVDPLDPWRVWFHSRVLATHTGSLLGKPPTGKQLELPTQVYHLDFNEDGKCKELGFYVADRRQGNTGGLGGAFGLFYGVGQPLPIPECRPYKPSFQFRMLNLIGRLGRRFRRDKTAEAA